jgi:hypothetical protein
MPGCTDLCNILQSKLPGWTDYYMLILDGPHTLTLYDNWYYHNILLRTRLIIVFIMYDKCCYHELIMTE